MKRSILSVTIVAALAAACGGKSPPATTSSSSTAAAAEPPAHDHGPGDHHTFPAEVGAFHDRLAPLWHSEVGAARTEATCTASGELDQLAEEMANAAPPAGVDAAAWSERMTALRAALSRLSDDCVATQGASLDGNFAALHDAFHALIALLPDDPHH